MEMKKYNPEADELNTIICSTQQAIFDLLSEKGRSVYIPKKGILGLKILGKKFLTTEKTLI